LYVLFYFNDCFGAMNRRTIRKQVGKVFGHLSSEEREPADGKEENNGDEHAHNDSLVA